MNLQEPAQVTTFLFTDIEGSTRLWEQKPQEMSRALKHHDAISRAAVESNRGVVVKMVGDGLYAAFADPLDGINATLALQEALADPASTEGVPLHVRCGLHLGLVEQRDNDFFGPPVNRSARIMAAAHGGQILVSQAVAERIEDRLPEGVQLRELGAVRLKDLSSPERVYQLLHPKLRQDFPALRSLESTPNNLPQQLTSFIGREHDLEELERLLQGSRLLSLVGMGGLGKTRLSLQVAADALDNFPDGAWFIDLAPIRDAALVTSLIAQTLGVQEEPGRRVLDTLCAHLKSRTALLILDNCEHLVHECATVANTLLRAACDLRIISTTREALHVPGEQTYQVLPLPAPESSATLEALARCDAVQLFCDRARMQKAGFTLTERDAPGVAELCTRLEGIPLALELAAARVRSLSIADINVRLRDRFKLLTGGGRVLLERQQTLRALVSWSYDLLTESEQVLFDRLGVFAAGFELDAAENVCGTEPLSSDDVLDLVASLVDKSLVMAEEREDGTRYRTLETIRDYAREKLEARGDMAAVAARHCDYFLAMAKEGRRGLLGAEQAHWIRRLEAEQANMRAAIVLALEEKVDPIVAVKFQVALMNFWIPRGYVSEARRSVDASLVRSAVRASPVAHAHALYVGATLAASQSDHETAVRMLEECLALRRTIGDASEVAGTLSTLSFVLLNRGDASGARERGAEALATFRELGNDLGQAISLLRLGNIHLYLSEYDEARRYFEQGLAIAARMQHAEMHSEFERMLGEVALCVHDLAAAQGHASRSLEICEAAGVKREEASTQHFLGRVALAHSDPAKAAACFVASLRAFHAFDMKAELLDCLDDVARILQDRGASRDAAELMAAADAVRNRLAISRSPRADKVSRDIAEQVRALMNAGELERARTAGEARTLDATVQRALALLAPTHDVDASALAAA